MRTRVHGQGESVNPREIDPLDSCEAVFAEVLILRHPVVPVPQVLACTPLAAPAPVATSPLGAPECCDVARSVHLVSRSRIQCAGTAPSVVTSDRASPSTDGYVATPALRLALIVITGRDQPPHGWAPVACAGSRYDPILVAAFIAAAANASVYRATLHP